VYTSLRQKFMYIFRLYGAAAAAAAVAAVVLLISSTLHP
jgi:hypothetical protein